MLAIYNENQTKTWVKAVINDRISKIITSRETDVNKLRYIDAFIDNNIEVNTDITTLSGMKPEDGCTTIYTGDTYVKFKSKDLKPHIVKSTKSNTDVLFINIDLHGRVIKNIVGDNHRILSYMIIKGELFVIFSIVKDSSVEIVLHDPNVAIDTTYRFSKNDSGDYDVTHETEQTDKIITGKPYKIMRFVPARPTTIVFVNDSDSEELDNVLKNQQYHTINVINDNDVNDLESFIDPLKQEGYRTVTLFVNSEDVKDTNDDVYTMLKENFKYVNILLKNGKVIVRH